MTSLNPTMTIGDQIAETVLLHRGADAKTALARAVEVLGLVGMPRPGRAGRQLPAPAVRRHAAAGDDRDGAGLRAEAADRRRADDRAGRDDPEADPRAHRRPAPAAGHGGHPGHPRPGGDRRARRPGRGHVRGQGDGVDHHGRGCSPTRGTPTPRRCSARCRRGLPTRSERLYSIPGMPPDLTAPPAACRFARAVPVRAGPLQAVRAAARGRQLGSPVPLLLPGRPGREGRRRGAAAGGRDRAERRERACQARRRHRCCCRPSSLVKNFAVTAGAVLQRKIGEVSAVADVSFSIRPGQTFGMVGESGCGKTTIGRLIAGLEKATSGAIILDGEDLTKLVQARAAAAQPQGPAHVPGLLRLDGPPDAGRPDPARAAGHPADRQPAGPAQQDRRDPGRGRAAPGRGRPVPARVLRRPAAAPGPGPGAHPAAPSS